jgi:hypothetical protein
VDKTGKIAPPILDRAMKRSALINRQGKKKSALCTICGDKPTYLREAQAIFVPRMPHFRQRRRLRAQIKAVESGRSWHSRVEYRIVFATLRRGHHFAVGAHGLDAITRKSLGFCGRLCRAIHSMTCLLELVPYRITVPIRFYRVVNGKSSGAVQRRSFKSLILFSFE